MHKILVIRLYFLLDALHVSDYVSPSSGATFIICTSHLVYAGICRYHTSGSCVAIAKQQPEVWYRQIPNLRRIRSLRSELFHADSRNITKLIAAFRNFAKAPKNSPAIMTLRDI